MRSEKLHVAAPPGWLPGGTGRLPVPPNGFEIFGLAQVDHARAQHHGITLYLQSTRLEVVVAGSGRMNMNTVSAEEWASLAVDMTRYKSTFTPGPPRKPRTRWNSTKRLGRRFIAISIGITVAIAIVGARLVYVSQPQILVTSDTQLWRSEDDAAGHHTFCPGPCTPLSQLKPGTRLRVVWDSYGKDYLAFFVVGPHWQTGWVLYGQHGLDGG